MKTLQDRILAKIGREIRMERKISELCELWADNMEEEAVYECAEQTASLMRLMPDWLREEMLDSLIAEMKAVEYGC